MGIDVGSRIRDYEIVAQLRLGGMATLFLARRSGAAGFAKAVAIKVIHPHLARDKAFRDMFVDEANISAKIDHPSVVHVEELGESDGTLFLVMEYVHGVTLSQLLSALQKKGKRLAPSLAVHVAAKVAEGLHAAHETLGDDGQPLGIVHRDVSPQNVLISSRGHVKLIDFGIAKARGRAQQTSTTSLKGKIRYMAPEQAYGRPVDRRADVYALAVVLWEMLTMKRMFSADDDLALLEQVRHPDPLPASAHTPEVTPALDAALMHALSPSADTRTASAADLRRELAGAMPDAIALDASQLADLVNAMLGEELAAERKRIPLGAGTPHDRTPPPPAPDIATRAIEAYTISDIRIAAQSPNERVVLGDQTSPPAVSVAVPMPAPGVAPPPDEPRGKVPLAAWAAGGVALVLVGGLVGWGALHMTQSEEPAPPIVLPQAAVQAPPIVAPPVVPQTIVPPQVVAVVPDAGAARVAEPPLQHDTKIRTGHGSQHHRGDTGHATPTGDTPPPPGGGGTPMTTSFD